MKRFLNLLKSPPITLAITALLAYGILIPQLGFYWDGLVISWIGYQLGPEALTQYFSTNRPAWGVLYNALLRFIPQQPLYWQIIAIFWHWLGSLAFFALVRELFPKQKKLALTASLLFLLYPGFNQQFVSFVYGYHFTVYTLFLFSLYAMLRTLRRPNRTLTSLGMLASALNLIMGEYFFVLDLIRPVLLWFALDEIADSKQRIKRGLWAWFPYLVIFAAGVLGRSLIFNNQVYGYSLLDELKAAPLPALWALIQTIVQSLYTTFVSAWGQAFILPDFELQGKVTIGIYIFILISLSFFLLSSFREKNHPVSERNRSEAEVQSKSGDTKTPVLRLRSSRWSSLRSGTGTPLIIIGFAAMLLAGVPFWLTDLPVSLGFPANRATLPFIFGSTLVLVGIVSLIPRQMLTTILLTLFIAFSAGRQFLWADEFRRDWRVQKNLFWQLSWRVPALEEDTLVMLNEGALKFYADNSLAAPLNWVYAPSLKGERIPYMVFYPRSRFGVDGAGLTENISLFHDFIAAEWHGNSNQMLLVNFDPPGCLHIVDPLVDTKNKFIADLLIRDNAAYSRPELILENGTPALPALYGTEPNQSWCYYYEKADLARQFGNWDTVVNLGKDAFETGDHPNDPVEYFPFIEGYAHAGNWARAEELSLQAYRVSKAYMPATLCPLWARIDTETPTSPEKDASVEKMQEKFDCKT